MIHNIKVVFFDLNNTLHDDSAERFFGAVQKACERYGPQAGIKPERLKDAYLARNQELFRLFAGLRDELPVKSVDVGTQVWGRILSEGGFTGIDPAAIAEELFQERIKTLEPFAEVAPLLRRLSDKYRLGLITNGQSNMQRGTLAALGLESHFPIVLVSGEFGFGKPSVEIFAEAARQAGVAHKDCVHIGDSLTLDIAGAKEAGMSAIWLNRDQRKLEPNDPQPDHTITSISKVEALLLN